MIPTRIILTDDISNSIESDRSEQIIYMNEKLTRHTNRHYTYNYSLSTIEMRIFVENFAYSQYLNKVGIDQLRF